MTYAVRSSRQLSDEYGDLETALNDWESNGWTFIQCVKGDDMTSNPQTGQVFYGTPDQYVFHKPSS